MNHLPGEILHSIFIHLPMIQKQECMLVCHDWEQIISTRSLFSSIICRNTDSCNRFLRMIEKTPLLGIQVKYLELHGDFDDDYDMTQLLCCFPHLDSIKISLNLSQDNEIHTFNTNEESVSLPSRLKCIEDGAAGELTIAMSAIGCFSHLITLKLNLQIECTSDEISRICRLTANMPVLKRLEIASGSLKLSHCESIHTHVPWLTSLRLYAIGENEEEMLPIDIQPATSITDFKIDFAAFPINEQNKWAHYVKKKYPQLQHLEFNNSYSFCTDSMIEHYYKFTIPTLVTSLGSQLESLHIIYESIDPTFFSTLDDADCKIKNLVLGKTTEIDTLIRSKQCRYIERLVLEMDPNSSFEWLSYLQVLRSFSCAYTCTATRSLRSRLDLSYLEQQKKMSINAINLFNSCSTTLESIDISAEFIDFNTNKIVIFPVSKLRLVCKQWPKEVDSFISNCLPHLKSLTIWMHGPDHEYLALPNHHLDYLGIDSSLTNGFTIALTTLDDNETRYYSVSDPQLRTGQVHFDDYIYPIPEPQDKVHLKVVCGSVKVLVIGKLHAHLVSSYTLST